MDSKNTPSHFIQSHVFMNRSYMMRLGYDSNHVIHLMHTVFIYFYFTFN